MTSDFENVEALIASEDPALPVYCVYPHVYRQSTKRFVDGFGGRTLYAVKANNHPTGHQMSLRGNGVRHFDCASIVEVELIAELCPDAAIYYMNPARLPNHARIAQERFGVRHFVVDHHSGLQPLLDEIDAARSVIFARMAVSHESALENLSKKYGARPENIPALLNAIHASGAEAALAFNVGTGVVDPAAYAESMHVARNVLQQVEFKVRLLDIGGGFPISYPDFEVPELEQFFERTAETRPDVPLADDGELLAEPGRALSGPGLSAVTRVLLKKADRIYLNDGIYGAFWELRFKGHLKYPCRAYHNGSLLEGATKPYRIFGPTCDSTDELPAPVELPETIGVGDHIEFGSIGAYSLSGRTDFNGFGSDHVITLTSENAQPPR